MDRRRWRANPALEGLLLVVSSLAFILVLLEIGIRIYSALSFHKLMLVDTRLGWKHASNVHKTFVNEHHEAALVVQNANGMRGPYYDHPRTPGKFRMLVLGDSFTEGCTVGEADLFSARLERADPHLEVLNAGVGGYGTIQEDLYLEDQGVLFSPDLVVVMMCDNDLLDNCWSYNPGFGLRPYGTLENGRLHIVTEPDPAEFARYALPAPFLQALNRHSYLYEFLNTRIYHRLFSARLKPRLREDMRKAETCPQDEILFGALERMHSLLQRRGIDLWTVLIPMRESVEAGRAPREEPIEAFCAKSGIRCIPLLPALRRQSDAGARPYFPVDIHWTKDGHRIAAEVIGESLRLDTDKTRAR